MVDPIIPDSCLKRITDLTRQGPLPGPFDSALVRCAVFVGVELAGLFCVMRRVQRVAVRNVSVMSGALVVTGFMMSGGFAVMFGCGFMMMGSLMMMFGAFVCHGQVSWKK